MKMIIADRNVYGVDLNPIAVELAEVSLWLNTIYKGAHVPWFGTQLACGNSLIGARRQVYNALKLKKGTWYNDEPEKVPEEWVTDYDEPHKVYKRKRPGGSYIYHFLLGDPGMANYTDKVIKELEPENIKRIKAWQKEFCVKYTDDDIEVLNKLSEIIDDLWMRTIYARQKVEQRTEDSLSVFGHDEGEYEEHLTIREKDAIYKNIYKSEGGDNACPYARLKAAMDYWCALWFWPIDQADLLPTRQQFFMELSLILEGGISATVKKGTTVGQLQFFYDEHGQFEGFGTTGSALANEVQAQISGLGKVNLEQIRSLYPRLRIANEIAEKQHFMHWELEFADLFYERGGFDLVIGNPPWIKTNWDITSFLVDKYPEVYIRGMKAADVQANISNYISDDSEYCDAYSSTQGVISFLGSRHMYYELQGMQTNLYKAFIVMSFLLASRTGNIGMIHPASIFDDSAGDKFRKIIYHRLRKHFRFENQKKLFKDVEHNEVFSINVYGEHNDVIRFQTIADLYIPSTIDECYDSKAVFGDVEGIKTETNEWNTKGHPDRIIDVDEEVLTAYAKLFEEGVKDIETAKLLALHCKQYVEILEKFVAVKKSILTDDNGCFCTEMWHETNMMKAGVIKDACMYPDHITGLVSKGPQVGVGNPYYQTPRKEYKQKSDYDRVDLESIGDYWIPRTTYAVSCSKENLLKQIPIMPDGRRYTDTYRVVARRRLSLPSERTLYSAIMAPGCLHVNLIFGMTFDKPTYTTYISGLLTSLPYDFLVRTIGKSDFRLDLAGKMPVAKGKYEKAIILRSLLLNCLTNDYRDLWEECFEPLYRNERWGKVDKRLNNNFFAGLTKEWGTKCRATNEFIRRQLLVEIDVLASMQLGLTKEELIVMYKNQFPVLKQYEAETYYDSKGRIAFRSRCNLALDKELWESHRNDSQGSFTGRIKTSTTDDEYSDITFYPPFDQCNREKDYEEVWANFEERFKK